MKPSSSVGTLAIIGGSKAYQLLQEGRLGGERLGEVKTPYGPSQPVYRLGGELAGALFLSRHGERGYTVSAPFVNYRANIYALKELGAQCVLSWSGPGAIGRDFAIGQYVVVDDLVDETCERESTFFKGKGWGFVRQNPVFCPTLRHTLCQALNGLDLPFAERGTYVCTQGPRLETPAEIRKFASFGCDLVGMTLCPEVFLAKELEMCYAAICYVTNYAEGIRERAFKPGELFEGLSTEAEQKAVAAAVEQFPAILSAVAKALACAKPVCQCHRLMERYRKRGDVGGNWHTWVAV